MFNLGEKMDRAKAKNLNPVALAFLGDAVYSLFIREKLVFSKDYKTGELNKLATSEVKATSQAEYARKIMPFLTEEEVLIYKRGRNAKKSTKSKSASVSDYNSSTGFEALLGYLYMTGNYERLNYILNKGRENEG